MNLRNILSLSLLLSACAPVAGAPDLRELSCENARAEALSECVQHDAHRRAGCHKSATRDYGTCLLEMGETARGQHHVCAASCAFLRITCEDQGAAIEGVDYGCAAEQVECVASCG